MYSCNISLPTFSPGALPWMSSKCPSFLRLHEYATSSQLLPLSPLPVTIPPCYYIALPLCCPVTMLSYHCAILLLCRPVTISSHFVLLPSMDFVLSHVIVSFYYPITVISFDSALCLVFLSTCSLPISARSPLLLALSALLPNALLLNARI